MLSNPSTFEEARHKFFGFAEEIRRTRKREESGSRDPDLVEVVEMPRFAKCYGWLRLNRKKDFTRMPRSVLPHTVRVGKHIRSLPKEQDEFIAVVYEYVEGGKNDTETVEKVATFLWLAGFSFCARPLARNWKSGVLVDHSDIVGPLFYGWQKFFYCLLSAETILAD